MLVDPCPCARNREAAMSCPRESRGRLVWTRNSNGFGPIEAVVPDGRSEVMIFGDEEWSHFSEGLARDHASIRHLDFVVARG